MPLLADIAAHGLERALESGRADHERPQHRPGMDSRRHVGGVGEYRDAVGSPEFRELLARSDTPDVWQHLAIIKLIDDIPPDGVFEIIAHPASAADAALEASKSAISGPDANSPARWSARDKRPQVRPQATNVLALRSKAPGRRPRWSAPGTTRPSAAALMTLLADTLSAELPAASLRAEQPPVCFPLPRAGRNSGSPLRGPLPLVHRARQGHGDGIPGEVGKRCAQPRVMRFWSKAVTRATGIARRDRRGAWRPWRGALPGAVEKLRPQGERRAA